MYTATIKSKTPVNGAIKVDVEFTDGVTSVIESCIPQDENGFKFWVKSRLAVFNSATEIDSTYAVNDPVDVTDPVVTPPVPTQEEVDRDKWIANYRKWVKVKTTLVDTGVLVGDEAQLVTLKNKVTNDFLPAYLDFII
jgi:hypothetical protein